VTLLGAILGVIESLTCGTTDMWDPHVSDSMAPRMARAMSPNRVRLTEGLNPALRCRAHQHRRICASSLLVQVWCQMSSREILEQVDEIVH
jgi:hypothetical protein